MWPWRMAVVVAVAAVYAADTASAFFQFQPAEGDAKGTTEHKERHENTSFSPPSSSSSSSNASRVCYTELARGRRLDDDGGHVGNALRTIAIASESTCRRECSKSKATCNFYSFGYTDENGRSGQCLLLSASSKRNVSTSAASRFSVFMRLDYCPEGSEAAARADRAFIEDNLVALDVGTPIALAQTAAANGVCFRLAVSSRRLADRYIKQAETAYSLEQCSDMCEAEKDFFCKGFAYRRPMSQGEVLNCDLSVHDTSTLDQYNSYDFYESAVTDFYERGCGGGGGTSPSGSSGPSASGPTADTGPGPASDVGVGPTASGVANVPVVPLDVTPGGGLCHRRLRIGSKHYAYRDYKHVFSTQHCAEECLKTTFCKSFSYRYTTSLRQSPETLVSGNCLLSDRRGVELSDADLVPATNAFPSSASAVSSALSSASSTDGEWDVFEVRSECAAAIPQGGPPGAAYNVSSSSFSSSSFNSTNSTLTFNPVSAAETTCAFACIRKQDCNAFAAVKNASASLSAPCLLSVDVAKDLGPNWTVYQRLCDQPPAALLQPSRPRACYRRERSGFKHYVSSVRDTLSATSLDHCAQECTRSRTCASFSFRFSRAGAVGTSVTRDNCLLSELGVAEVFATDAVVLDSDWDLYQNVPDPRCLQAADHPYDDGTEGSRRDADCYLLVRAGQKHHGSTVGAVLTAQSAADCASRCSAADLSSRAAVDLGLHHPPGVGACRSFSFRANRRFENCLASAAEAAQVVDHADLLVDAVWNFYEKLDSGEECPSNAQATGTTTTQAGDCFRTFRGDHKHYTSVIKDTISASGASSCARECAGRGYCRSFSFRNLGGLLGGALGLDTTSTANCALSAIEAVDINSSMDLVADPDWDVYEMLDVTGRCFLEAGGFGQGIAGGDIMPGAGDCYRSDRSGYKFYSTAVIRMQSARDLRDCSAHCEIDPVCRSFAFRDGGFSAVGGGSVGGLGLTGSGGPDNCQLSSLVVGNIVAQDLVADREWSVFQKTGSHGLCRDDVVGGGGALGGVGEALGAGGSLGGLGGGGLDGGLDPGLGGLGGGGGGFGSSFSSRRPGLGHSEGCSNRLRQGHRHRSSSIGAQSSALDHEDCQLLCRRRPGCVTFSFRYGSSSSRDSNCLLSDADVDPRDSLGDLEPDREWDAYRIESSALCGGSGLGHDRFPAGGGGATFGSDCFRVFDSRRRFPDRSLLSSLRARHESDCEQACAAAGASACRAFAFSARATGNNCQLAAVDLRGADLRNGLVRDPDFSVYERRRDKWACQGETVGGAVGGGSVSGYPHQEQVSRCSSLFRVGFRMTARRLRAATEARSVLDCEDRCNREVAFACTGFAFSTASGRANCELTDGDVRAFDPRYDLQDDRDWSLYEKTRFATSECGATNVLADMFGLGLGLAEFVGLGGPAGGVTQVGGSGDVIFNRMDCYDRLGRDTTLGPAPASASSSLPEYSSSLGLERVFARDRELCAEACDKLRDSGHADCQAFAYSSGAGTLDPNCLLSSSRGRNLHEELRPALGSEVWKYRDISARGCRGRAHNTESALSTALSQAALSSAALSSALSSVSGKRCRSSAQLNGAVRYWFCQTEDDAGIGSGNGADAGWDYCCRPGSKCAYSQGYQYPWCYVGEAGFDQWRPCYTDPNNFASGMMAPDVVATKTPAFSSLLTSAGDDADLSQKESRRKPKSRHDNATSSGDDEQSSRILGSDSADLTSSSSSSWPSLAVAPPPLRDMAPSPENAHLPASNANATEIASVGREGKTEEEDVDDTDDQVAVVSFGLQQKGRSTS